MKLCLAWVHFGPYHMARLQALRQLADVTPLEFASGELKYGWSGGSSREVVTLSDGAFENCSQLQIVARAWKTLEATKPDVVFVPGYGLMPALAIALWAKWRRRPSVLMTDSTTADHVRVPWKEAVKGSLVHWLFPAAMVSGAKAGDYLRGLGALPATCAQRYDVVDNQHFACEPKRTAGGFLSVSRLANEKNIAGLLNAYERYIQLGGTWNLDLVGDGPLREDTNTKAARFGDRVAVRGRQDYASLPGWYAASRCLILASLSEPWGLVVNEAMAAGLPILLSDRCGCAEELLENGSNGFLFDPHDTDQLANLMLQMEKFSDAQREAMGLRSQALISEFTPENWALEVAALSRQLTSQRIGKPCA